MPDPRRYHGGPTDNPLLRLAQEDGVGQIRLREQIRVRIRQGGDAEILQALRCAPSCAVYRQLWESVCAASEDVLDSDEQIATHLFAIPLVLVAGAKSRVILPGAVPDIDAVCALLQKHGAFGAMRNLGLGNALCSSGTVERITPGEAFRWSTEFAASGVPRALEARAIEVAPGREQVHLRFLIGATIVPQAVAPFPEAAANIGAWGMPLTRLLAQQLAQPGLELLPVPRPPAAILKAAHLGRDAELGLSFNLFVSNGVRQFRATVGDPVAILAAHQAATGGAEIRVSLSSAFDDTLLEGFRWPLHPADDFEHTLAGITGLLQECRVSDIRMMATVMPDSLPGGALFIRVADYADHARAAAGLTH
ncbi:MAG: hypothetical protein AABZ67_02480 [Pseudomonadota bacterium]